MCAQLVEKKRDILDQSFEEVAQQLNVEIGFTEKGGRTWKIGDYGGLMKRLITFMKYVLYTKEVPFHIEWSRGKRKVAEASPLAWRYKNFHYFMDLQWEGQIYSPDLELFFECFRSHPSIGHCIFVDKRQTLDGVLSEAEVFNDFVACLRREALVQNTKKRMSDWRDTVKDEKKSIRRAIDRLKQFSKILGVRVDLNYLQCASGEQSTKVRAAWELGDASAWSAKADAESDIGRCDENAARLDADIALQDRARFFEYQRTSGKDIFENMIGYIMKMERSDDGPHHFHCIFFFDGQKVQSVKYLVKKIEAYWKVITEGRGYVHNCHINPKREELEKADKWVVGKIRGSDQIKLGKLTRYVMWYFAKDEQRVRAKPKVKSRLLTTGLMRKKKKKGLGGPERRGALREPISL